MLCNIVFDLDEKEKKRTAITSILLKVSPIASISGSEQRPLVNKYPLMKMKISLSLCHSENRILLLMFIVTPLIVSLSSIMIIGYSRCVDVSLIRTIEDKAH